MTAEMIVTESRELHQLTAQMQRHVDRTLAADRQGGEALWEKALAVADARAEATKGGEWGAFLQATGQHERAARRLVAIAERGRKEERFRTAIISGWLTFSVGAIVAQADDELLTNLLEQPTPPTHNQVKALTARPDNVVRSLNPATTISPISPVAPNPLAAVVEALRKNNPIAAYAAARDARQDSARALAAVDAQVAGKSLATVLAMLEEPTRIKIATDKGMEAVTPIRRTDHIALCVLDGKYSITHIGTGYRVGGLIPSQKEAAALFDQAVSFTWSDISGNVMGDTLRSQIKTLFPPEEKKIDPTLSAFPPGHVEAGIGAIERRLKDGTSNLAEDIPWAAKLRTQLDDARTGMNPEVYGTWSARLDAARSALAKLKDVCADCGTPTFLLMKSVEGHLIKLCEKCTTNRGLAFDPAKLSPVNRARRLGGSLDEVKAPKRSGVPDSYVLRLPGQPDQEFIIEKHQPDRALVNAMEKIALWEQTAVNAAIEAPQAAPVKKATSKTQAVRRQHAEALLAGIIERSTPAELRLLHALICPDPPSADVSGDVWEAGKEILDLESTDFEWIEQG